MSSTMDLPLTTLFVVATLFFAFVAGYRQGRAGV
jgi:hypothetical protein